MWVYDSRIIGFFSALLYKTWHNTTSTSNNKLKNASKSSDWIWIQSHLYAWIYFHWNFAILRFIFRPVLASGRVWSVPGMARLGHIWATNTGPGMRRAGPRGQKHNNCPTDFFRLTNNTIMADLVISLNHTEVDRCLFIRIQVALAMKLPLAPVFIR